MSAKNILKSLNKKSELQKALPIVNLIITTLVFISASPVLAQQRRLPNSPTPQPVPEPSSAVGMLAVATVGAGLVLKRKLKSNQSKTRNDSRN